MHPYKQIFAKLHIIFDSAKLFYHKYNIFLIFVRKKASFLSLLSNKAHKKG